MMYVSQERTHRLVWCHQQSRNKWAIFATVQAVTYRNSHRLFHKYQTQVQRLIYRGIWKEDDSTKLNQLSFFRSKLKPDISQQLVLLFQQHAIQESKIDMETIHKYARLAMKFVLRFSTAPTSAVIQQASFKGPQCFYCDQTGHRIE